MTADIRQGDAVIRLGEMDPESVHLIVTSVPYGSIVDYGHEGQIGHGQSLAAYRSSLKEVWRECWRVLRPGCKLCVNIGDQYRATGEVGDKPYHITPLGSMTVGDVMDSHPDPLFMGSIIWNKVTNTDTSGGASVMGSYPNPRNGCLDLRHEYIHVFKKPGSDEKPDLTDTQYDDASMTIEEWRENFNALWKIPGESATDHPAPFPAEIPRRLIRMYSWPEDLVVDPFVGSGTTCVVAEELDRDSVGIDLVDDYCAMARDRLS